MVLSVRKEIWLGAVPSLKDTPAERYLLRRGIDLGVLGRQPRALRCHPALWDKVTKRHWPALVALVNTPGGVDGPNCAVHRIWLTADGQKAPIPPTENGQQQVKRGYGPKRGGWIPLSRGQGADGRGGKPLRQAPEGSAVWLAEGIEDGLSIALLTGGADRVLAAIDLGNMALMELLPAISTIVIAGQNDEWWSDGQDRTHGTRIGLDKAIRHFQQQGREVRVWRTDKPGCKDANDHIRRVLEEGRNVA